MHARASERTLKALDALLARWIPVVSAVGGPAPATALQLVRAGVDAARIIDAALQSLGSDADHTGASLDARPERGASLDARPDRDADPAPLTRSAGPFDIVTIGLAALARPLANLIRRPYPRGPRWTSRRVRE